MKFFLLSLAILLQLSLSKATSQSCNGCNNQPSSYNPCSPNPCANSGLCGTNSGSNYKCICAPNYTGTRCEVAVVSLHTTTRINSDFCSFRPCMNGGSCININNPNVNPPYACVCPSTMTGSRCEVPVQPIYHPTTRQIQPCSQNPCASGSTCLQTTQSPFPSCVCPPNRTGPTCNQVVTHAPPTYNPCNNNNINNPCSPVITTPFNPCQNNPCGSGQCHNNGFNNYMCQCPPNLTGQNCNQPIITTTPFNPCALNPCQTGTCINQGFSYTCQCPNGYSGQRCEIRNPCIDNPCRSGGTCVPGTNSFYCICNPLYTGSRCEIYAVITTTQNYHNPCQPNPCQYGGQCINQQQTQYVCSCRPQYTGSTCGKRIDSPSLIEDYLNSIPAKQYQPNPCSASPCQSGSTCININQPNVNPPYACVCPPNFTGPRCDQPLNPCGTSQNCNPVATPNPCQNINCNPVTTPNPCQNFNCNPVTTPNPCQNFNCNPVTTPNPCQNCNPNTLPPITTRPTLPPNPCSSNPCNSGTCHSSNQGYSCQCPSGFTGQNCNQVDMCTTNTCYNGGTCQTQRTGQDQYTVSCTCPPAYTGSRCQSPIVITTTRQTAPACQCMNNGVCQPSGQCQCQQNFYGQNCQYYTTTRPPCQCLNNGFCQPSGVCQCQNNYFGNNCQYRSNTLLPSSSESSSTCPAGLCVQGTCAVIPQGGASYCICNFGWTGPRCNIRNYCQSSTIPCKNGGTCVNGHNDYYCVCNSQTTGKYCEMPIQSNKKSLPDLTQQNQARCPINFCFNGGVCEMKLGIPHCTCSRGFFGPRCNRAY